MSTPKTWDLLSACQTCLQRISVANGFYTNAGATASLEPGQVSPDADLALAVVIDSLAAAESDAGKINQAFYQAGILVFAKVGVQQADAQIRLHELIADVRKAFMYQQGSFPSGIQFPRFISAAPIPPADGMLWVGWEIRFTAQVPVG
jgi:hypothetical protein